MFLPFLGIAAIFFAVWLAGSDLTEVNLEAAVPFTLLVATIAIILGVVL